jgi:predicted kinase
VTKEQAMKVMIMSGLPGCGKSEHVKYMIGKVVTCSADHYHEDVNGLYEYDPSKNAEAHNRCLSKYVDCLINQLDTHTLVVDNTNTTTWEIAPYYRLAEIYNVQVEIVRWICPIELSIKRNVHNVPISTILSMYNNLMNDKLPPWWKIRYEVTEDPRW